MTRSEAAKICQSIKFMMDKDDYSEEVEEALNMAIAALKQLSLPKIIIRQGEQEPSAHPFTEEQIQTMQEIEAAQVEKAFELGKADRPKWIPVSERLPENDKKVLCQTVTKKGQINMVIGFYDFERWCCGMNSNVIAWMPLPEAYREDGEKE